MDTAQTRTIIVMGPQGSGKGTQLSLLKKYFEEELKQSVFQFSTGDGFRKLLTESTYTSGLVSAAYNSGKLQPLFLTVALWGQAFMQSLQAGQSMFIDGYPRTVLEAEVLETAFQFYGCDQVDVLFFDVPEADVIARMKLRGRSDDTDAAIAQRLEYYRNNTVPIFEYFKTNPRYIVHTIDARPAIDEIHRAVLSALTLRA